MATKGRSNFFFQHGQFAGLTDYRYGSPPNKPTSAGVKQNGIYRGEKHRHVVDRVLDVMRDWRLSPFELEGTVHHALRSGLCLAGHTWHRADRYAGDVVAEALRLMGAKRPSYAQGQWEYTVARETCTNCLGELDEEDILARRRFCSPECRDMKRVEDPQRYDWLMKITGAHASHQRTKEKSAPRICGRSGCGKEFKSINEKARFCSLECFSADSITVETRPCQQCGTTFRPTNNVTPGRFCSVECTNDSFRQIRVYSVCECCQASFVAGNQLGRYCSNACKKFAGRVNRGEVSRVTPRVFDYLYTGPPSAPREKITPHRLDWLFLEAGLRVTAEVRVAA